MIVVIVVAVSIEEFWKILKTRDLWNFDKTSFKEFLLRKTILEDNE